MGHSKTAKLASVRLLLLKYRPDLVQWIYLGLNIDSKVRIAFTTGPFLMS